MAGPNPGQSYAAATDVGKLYHVVLATADGTSVGYMLVNGQEFHQKTDLRAQQTLVQTSPNLTDRDLVTWPRVSDGDFSGGGLQQIFVNPKKYWDSDLEIRTPGSLQLRPAWNRITHKAAPTRGTGTPQAVVWNADVYVTYNETNGRVYNSAGQITAAGIPVAYLDTDGQYLYASDGVNTLKHWNGSSWTTDTAALGAHTQIWAVNQGTAGHFIYYTPTASSLSRWDLSAASSYALPMGGNPFSIVDVVPYGGSVAILTSDLNNAPGFNVWYHDGQNLQQILRMTGYYAGGLTNCLGNLFITAIPTAQVDSPILAQIGSGSFDIVAQVGLPSNQTGAIKVGAPVSSGQTVAFAVQAPTINGVSSAAYVATYDVLTQAYSHLGNLDATDNPGLTVRSLAYLGRALFAPMILSSNGVTQYQSNQTVYSPRPAYATTGKLVSSRFDFNTPGIGKMFRRVVVHHAPLAAGEQVKVDAFVNLDPAKYSSALTPTATNTHVYSGGESPSVASSTVLSLPQHTTGFSLYFAVTVTAGTSQATSPAVYYVSTEISVPWTFEMTLDCTTRRMALGNVPDPSQLLGTDMFFFLHNAWENAQQMTLYPPNGNTYTVEIQSLDFNAPTPKNMATPLNTQDQFECHAAVVFTESIV